MPSKKTTPKPKSKQDWSDRRDLREDLSDRFLRAEDLIKYPPLAHPRGKDGGWGH